ncbi:MAG: long-chain fatty acid--CoA ligase [Trueperaceae bacterium]|nr:long-chain fatty acid--CoA ligase [Trueperaceae bacterium]
MVQHEVAQQKIVTAPEDSGDVVLGRTLPSLLDEACRHYGNERALNRYVDGAWQSLSTTAFRDRAEALALGLRTIGLEPPDRVAFYMRSDPDFCVADMACLMAGLTDVPIYLTHSDEAVRHIVTETEARALIVSDAALLGEIAFLWRDGDGGGPEHLILATSPDNLAESLPDDLPDTLNVTTLERLEQDGRSADEDAAALRDGIRPDDLATIIYTSGTTGTPKGVMLSHENISFNALAAFSGLPGLARRDEVAISFLPLSHVFARTLYYGYLNYGTAVYFTEPDDLGDHLQGVAPTIMATVPRVLEKVLDRIKARGRSLSGVQRWLFAWSFGVAERYDVTDPPSGLDAVQHRLADTLAFSRWREGFGGRLRWVIVGGAALRPKLGHMLGAAGLDVLQGYGLTETSPVISFNRPDDNRPETVGPPIAGTEVTLSDEQEILTRGPHVMQGYFRQPDKTAETIDDDGWLHTGDRGELSDDGFLKITGRLKNLFKLSTGKYVMPQPIEDDLAGQDVIDHAVVVGEGRKYCAALLFIDAAQLAACADERGVTRDEALVDAAFRERVKEAVARANAPLPHWSRVKRAALIDAELTTDNGMLTPTLKVRRQKVVDDYHDRVEAIYDADPDQEPTILEIIAPDNDERREQNAPEADPPEAVRS